MSFGRSLAIYLFFVVCPLFLVGVFGGQWLDARDREARSQARLQAQRFIRKLGRSLDPVTRLDRRFLNLARTFDRVGYSESNAQAILRRWQDKSAGIEIYVFDALGRGITPRSINLQYRFVMSLFWRFLRGTLSPMGAEFQRWSRTFFGMVGNTFVNFEPGRIPRDRLLLRPAQTPEARSLFWHWDVVGQGGGFIILLDRLPAPSSMPLHRLRLPRGWNAFLTPPASSPIRLDASLRLEVAEQVTALMKTTGQEEAFHENTLWHRLPIHDHLLFLGHPMEPASQGIPVGVSLSLLGLTILGFIPWRRWEGPGAGRRFSLRMKLPGIVLYALSLPFLGIAILGGELIRDTESSRRAEFGHTATGFLTTLEEGFEDEKGRLLSRFRSIRHRVATAIDSPDHLRRLLETEVARYSLTNLTLYPLDPQAGKRVEATHFSQIRPEPFNFFNILGREFHLRERIASETPGGGSGIPAQIWALLNSPFSGVSEIFERPDRLHSVQTAESDHLLYWYPFKSNGFPFGTMFGTQSVEQARECYLRRLFRRSYRFKEHRMFLGVHQVESRSIIAQARRLPRGLRGLLWESQHRGIALTDEMDWNGAPFLAEVIPSSRFPGQQFFLLVPSEFISRETSRQWNWVLQGLCLFLIFAIFIGAVLSTMFLTPVSKLVQAVDALRQRNREFRIKEIQSDELGQLALTFNRFLETTEELELARIVQDNLIPRHPPDIPGYEVAFRYFPATELAGDYIDFIKLRSGKLLITCGDVTGHGAGSAILMAMVKSALVQTLSTTEDPGEILSRLNRSVHEFMGRKLLMSLFLGILDPGRHVLCASNAGHPFPKLDVPGQPLQDVKSVSMPLGASMKAKFPVLEIPLEQHACLTVYSDGLYEALSPTGEVLGFEQIERTLSGTPNADPAPSAEERCRNLIDLFHRHSGGREAADDVSILVVKRIPEDQAGNRFASPSDETEQGGKC